jgi:hypothetical protein
VGDRRDHRFRHPLCQDRGHRRTRPVCRAGLAHAHYRIWVRGYGLVDSPKVDTEPGKGLDLTAVVAPSIAAAAQYYPAACWYSMIKIPDRSGFPGTGDKGNGIPENFKTHEQWLNFIKTNGCGNCHQMGNYATRTISEKLGKFEPSQHAWPRRSLEP